MASQWKSNTLVTTAQAARMLGVHSRTVARWIDQGNIWAVLTPGRHRRVPLRELDKFWTAPPGKGHS